MSGNAKNRRKQLRARAAELNKLRKPDTLPLDVIESAALNLKRLGAIPMTATGSNSTLPPLVSLEAATNLLDDELYQKALEAAKK